MWSVLLASVSALTLFAGANLARAEDRMKVVFGATGGLVSGENSAADSFVDSGIYNITSIDVPRIEGDYLGLTVGAEVMPLWDVRAKLGITHTDPTTAPFDYNDGSDKLGEVGTEFNYQTLDLEVGYTPVLDEDLEVRFVGGVRGLHYDDSISVRDKIGEGGEGYEVHDNEFVGAGPRVGIEASQRFEDSPFGLSASAAGSVIFGTLDRSMNDIALTSIDKTVVSLEGKVGVDYYLGDVGKLTAGYRAEMLSNVHDFEVNASALQAGQLTQGPVLEFLGSF